MVKQEVERDVLLQLIPLLEKTENASLTVADPGFDLRGGVDFVNGGKGGRKSSESVVG